MKSSFQGKASPFILGLFVMLTGCASTDKGGNPFGQLMGGFAAIAGAIGGDPNLSNQGVDQWTKSMTADMPTTTPAAGKPRTHLASSGGNWVPRRSVRPHSHPSLKWLGSNHPMPPEHARCLQSIELSITEQVQIVNSGVLSDATEALRQAVLRQVNDDWAIAPSQYYRSWLEEVQVQLNKDHADIKSTRLERATYVSQLEHTQSRLRNATTIERGVLMTSLKLFQEALSDIDQAIMIGEAKVTLRQRTISFLECAIGNNLPPQILF